MLQYFCVWFWIRGDIHISWKSSPYHKKNYGLTSQRFVDKKKSIFELLMLQPLPATETRSWRHLSPTPPARSQRSSPLRSDTPRRCCWRWCRIAVAPGSTWRTGGCWARGWAAVRSVGETAAPWWSSDCCSLTTGRDRYTCTSVVYTVQYTIPVYVHC